MHQKMTMKSTQDEDYNNFVVIPCTGCQTRHTIYPPAPEYTSTMYNPCTRGDYQKGFFDCIICKQRNTFYCHKRHRELRYAR